MINFLINYWNDLLVALVGLSALVVYRFEKRDKLKIAATLIQIQIDTIEKQISALKNDMKLGNITVYNTQIILKENAWDQYRHLFVKLLNNSEYNLVQSFFDNAERLERARGEIVETIKTAWHDKSITEHQAAAEIIKDKKSISELEAFHNQFAPLDIVFTADITIASL